MAELQSGVKVQWDSDAELKTRRHSDATRWQSDAASATLRRQGDAASAAQRRSISNAASAAQRRGIGETAPRHRCGYEVVIAVNGRGRTSPFSPGVIWITVNLDCSDKKRKKSEYKLRHCQ